MTTPDEPQALTDEQIDAIGLKCSDYDDPVYFRVMARHVEAAVRAALRSQPRDETHLASEYHALMTDVRARAAEIIWHSMRGSDGDPRWEAEQGYARGQWR